MKRPDATKPTSTQAGAANNSSNVAPSLPQHSASTCGLESGKIPVYRDAANKEGPHGLDTSAMYAQTGADDRTLEEHAHAIQRYREEYDRTCAEAAYDAAAEEAYREHCTQQRHDRMLPKRPALLLYSEIQLERTPAHGVRRRLPKPMPGRLQPSKHRRSTKITGRVAVFVSVFTVAVTPLLRACILTDGDAFSWIFSAECSAFVAAVVAWCIRCGGQNRRRLGTTSGITFCLGLGIAQLALRPDAALLALALASAAIFSVVLLAMQPARPRAVKTGAF